MSRTGRIEGRTGSQGRRVATPSSSVIARLALPYNAPVSSTLRLLANQAFSRTAGAPLVAGNRVRLLRDARENYPAWLDAIASARRWIHFESYILYSDRAGRMFAEALAERARAGVQVRVLCDWLGSLNKTSRAYWRGLQEAGIEARLFNPLRLAAPLAALSRDHRKMIAIDGHTAFVAGLCVGDQWVGDPGRDIEPWRDTGVGIEGPAVADIEAAFADAWAHAGPPLPDEERQVGPAPPAGDVALRVVASMPSMGGVLRLDQLVAAVARHRLWVSDAYFVGGPLYVEALLGAARDGVDVRLLVPGSGTDLAAVQRLTRAGYRVLLEGGVRVFEWNGTMMHAKTAVADGRWARVGSTNLNLQSWLGNWELDVAVEDDRFGAEMEALYEADLANTTEIVLSHRRVRPTRADFPGRKRRRGSGSTSRAAAGALRIGNTFGAVLTAKRPVGPAEAVMLLYGAGLALGVATLALVVPALVAIPLGLFVAWLGLSWGWQSWKLFRAGRREPRGPRPEPEGPREAAG
ncbi:MAG: cardiolipin synthase B [Acidobacteria bacterium]|nr:cardiolipin synthase B [Acidobacteriota bacterium]